MRSMCASGAVLTTYAAARAQSRDWKLQYAMATVGVVLSEKVDTTLSKGVLRILGTISGGVIGAPPAKSALTRRDCIKTKCCQ